LPTRGHILKAGDLVKSTRFATKHAIGIIIGSYMVNQRDISFFILWNDGERRWQTPRQLEILSESR